MGLGKKKFGPRYEFQYGHRVIEVERQNVNGVVPQACSSENSTKLGDPLGKSSCSSCCTP